MSSLERRLERQTRGRGGSAAEGGRWQTRCKVQHSYSTEGSTDRDHFVPEQTGRVSEGSSAS